MGTILTILSVLMRLIGLAEAAEKLLAGFQAHLAKPFDVGELVLLIADLVGRQAR